ncbi:MAG TPA: hypothetical protein VJ740_07750 [Hyphomicrobiaceae bacterium]|jgi:hypothetical protein|nr:hypothetical protein [Hyphomicrobiaceae bacterium]
MLKKAAGEFREIAWLASVVGGLSVVGVTIAVAMAFALERLTVIGHI